MFSLENESSFNAVYTYYTKMSHFRNSAEIPIILVGTQGLFENNLRKKLAKTNKFDFLQTPSANDHLGSSTIPGRASWPKI